MTESEIGTRFLLGELIHREADIIRLEEIIEGICKKHHICEICKYIDSDGCTPGYITCHPEWAKPEWLEQ